MRTPRRDFLRKSLLAIGAAASAATARGVSAAAGTDVCPPTAALTPDGKLVQIQGNTAMPLLPGLPPDDPQVRAGVPGRKWVMVVDLSRCDGCRKCTGACQQMHCTPPNREWIRVFTMQDAKETSPYFFPKACFHCDNPPCTKVCPVGATFKRQDGIVLIDNERCIGCRFCIAACPYSSRYFNWGRPETPAKATQAYSPETGFPRRVGTVEKCDFCAEMLAAGQLPHCASACAKGVIYFGDQLEDAVTNGKGETEQLSKLLRDRAGYRFMEDLGTEPRAYYLPPKNRMYPAPKGTAHG